MTLFVWKNLLDTPRPLACMADFVRVVDVGPFWKRSILWYQFAGFGTWVVDLTLDLGGRSCWFCTLVVDFVGIEKNDFEMCRNEFWELFVLVISLWNMNFGLVLSGG